MILWLLVLILGLWMVKFKIKTARIYKLASLLPKPKDNSFLLGMTHKFVGNMEVVMDQFIKLSYESMHHNGLLSAWLGYIFCIGLTNPADMDMVLKTCLEKDDLSRFMRTIIGNGLIFAPVNIWRKRRKIIAPTFSSSNLTNFVELLSDRSEKFAEALEPKANKKPFMMWPFLSSYTLFSVCEATMEINTNNSLNSENFLKSINKLIQLVSERIFHLWLHPDWLYKLFPQYQEHTECLKNITRFVDEGIERRRTEITSAKKNEAYHLTNIENSRRFFLDSIIRTSGGENGYSNVELREEIIVLMAAGMDTSATTLGNVIKLLAKYPKVQENLYKELHEVFDGSDRPLVAEDFSKLKYMERVIKETQRLFPPVPFIVRKALEDITLPSGRVIPADSNIICSIFGVHRDPKYWGPNAEHFDPDRFLPERFNLTHACSYMPFSYGPRNCVGYRYAMMVLKAGLAAVLRRFQVVEDKEAGPVPFFKVKFDVTMKPTDDYLIALEKRKLLIKI